MGGTCVRCCKCCSGRGFDSHQLNYAFSYFLIFLFSYFLIFLFSCFPISFFSFFSSFIRSYLYIYTFQNAARTNSMHSVRKMFHRTERSMKRSRYFECDKCWQALMGVMGGRSDRGGRGSKSRWFDSHQLNCAFSFSYFLIFLFSCFFVSLFFVFMFSCFRVFVFSYFLLFLFHPIILSSYHICIFVDFIFVYLKNPARKNHIQSIRKMFHRTEWV
jgi:hypothetical protein